MTATDHADTKHCRDDGALLIGFFLGVCFGWVLCIVTLGLWLAAQ